MKGNRAPARVHALVQKVQKPAEHKRICAGPKCARWSQYRVSMRAEANKPAESQSVHNLFCDPAKGSQPCSRGSRKGASGSGRPVEAQQEPRGQSPCCARAPPRDPGGNSAHPANTHLTDRSVHSSCVSIIRSHVSVPNTQKM